MQGIDGSYTQLTVADAQKFYADGKRIWIQCLWDGVSQPQYRVENLRNALAGGLLIAGYISLTASGTGQGHVAAGRAGAPDDLWVQLRFVAVDVELSGIQVAVVREAVDVLATPEYGSKRRVIYTSRHAWMDLMGNPTNFADCTLWNADWDGLGLDREDLPFGSWTAATLLGKQYNGGTVVDGVYVDLSEFNDNLLGEDLDMPDLEAQRENSVDKACLALLAAAAGDDMARLIGLLVFFKILPPGAVSLFPSVDAASQAQQGK